MGVGNGHIDMALARRWGQQDGRDRGYLDAYEYDPHFLPEKLDVIHSRFRQRERMLLRQRNEALTALKSSAKERVTRIESIISRKLELDRDMLDFRQRITEAQRSLTAGSPPPPGSPGYAGLTPEQVESVHLEIGLSKLQRQDERQRYEGEEVVARLRGDEDRWRQIHRRFRDDARLALEEIRPIVMAYCDAFVSAHPRREELRRTWRPPRLDLSADWVDEDLPEEFFNANGQSVSQAWQYFLSLYQAPRGSLGPGRGAGDPGDTSGPGGSGNGGGP
jgi:hypothetical protein